jgi:hypothetical protein
MIDDNDSEFWKEFFSFLLGISIEDFEKFEAEQAKAD